MILPLKSIRVTTEAKHKPTKIKFYLKKNKFQHKKKKESPKKCFPLFHRWKKIHLWFMCLCVRQEKNQYECFFPLSFPDGKKILQISFCAFSQMEKTKK